MRPPLFLILLAAACSELDPSVGPLSNGAGSQPYVDAGPASFRRDIRPLMNRSNQDPTGHGCKYCHYSTEGKHTGLDLTGLDLSTLGSLRLGGRDTGTSIVVPFSPSASAIVQKLRGTYALGTQMPKDGPAFWNEDQIRLVERWISEGAVGADDE